MNAGSGIFTASKPGIYFFSFSGMGWAQSWIHTQLCLNGNVIGTGIGDTESDDAPTFTLQSTLQLNAGDQVSLKLRSDANGFLHDDGSHFTHFTGWLLQEDFSYTKSFTLY